MPNIKTRQDKKLHLCDKIQAKEKFNHHIIDKNALATNNVVAEKFDLTSAKQKSSDAMIALGANNGLQAMLVAQMLSIHELQQRAMTYAFSADGLELKKYYTNTGIKLANCFVQQAHILSKIQGVGGQKIIVERVNVHRGGQAVVGNIQGDMGGKDK